MQGETIMQAEAGLWPAQPSSSEAAKQAAAKKNRYYALLYREMADRRRAEGQLRINYGLLSALSHAQLRFLSGADLATVFADLLESLLEVTGSSFGFIADAHFEPKPEGLTVARVDSSIAGADELVVKALACVTPEVSAADKQMMERLAKLVLKQSKSRLPVMSSGSFPAFSSNGEYCDEDAADMLDSYTFLGLPLFAADDTVGVLALGDRKDGYDEELVELLQPVQSACTQMIVAKRVEDQRRRAEESLSEERASLAQRVEDSTAELRSLNAELQYAVRAKDEFLAMVNHELRTPLNAVLLLTEVLHKGIYGELNEKQLRSVRDIADSGRHLLSLITDILDVSKMEAGKLELETGHCDVRDVCDSSLQLVQGMAQKNNIRISLEIGKEVEEIWADSKRLKQMLVNLLSNAVKFTPAGGSIGLQVAGDDIEEVVVFTVWDTGIGIAKEDIPKLFQPFVQIDSGCTRQYGGSGLGLVLVSNMAKMHGGTVTVESEVDQGSTFTIKLPWIKEAEEDDDFELLTIPTFRTPPQPSPKSEPQEVVHRRTVVRDKRSRWDTAHPAPEDNRAAHNGKEAGERHDFLAAPCSKATGKTNKNGATRSPTILIVDDNTPNVDALAEYLCILDCELAVAHDGLEAIRKAKEVQPQLILMDLQMPEMDGIEATRRIRTIPELSDTPIVALTANVMPGEQDRCLEAGMTDFLGKPVDLDNLDRIIYQYAGIGTPQNEPDPESLHEPALGDD